MAYSVLPQNEYMTLPRLKLDRAGAALRWAENKPVTVAGFAAAMGVSYATGRNMSLSEGFPKMGKWIFRVEFEAWRHEQVKQAARQAGLSTRAGRPSSSADKCGGSSETHDSPIAWPRRAARLLAQVQ